MCVGTACTVFRILMICYYSDLVCDKCARAVFAYEGNERRKGGGENGLALEGSEAMEGKGWFVREQTMDPWCAQFNSFFICF